jgi:hypothetical protein
LKVRGEGSCSVPIKKLFSGVFFDEVQAVDYVFVIFRSEVSSEREVSPQSSQELCWWRPGFDGGFEADLDELGFVPKLVDYLSTMSTKRVKNAECSFFMREEV